MNRGPQTGFRPKGGETSVQKAHAAWDVAPDWIIALAEYADEHTAKKAAARIGYSDAYVSNAILNKFRGDIERFEDVVRGALLGVIVQCPILGEIGRDRCLKEQRKPRRATSSTSLRLHAACRNGCPNFRGAK